MPGAYGPPRTRPPRLATFVCCFVVANRSSHEEQIQRLLEMAGLAGDLHQAHDLSALRIHMPVPVPTSGHAGSPILESQLLSESA
jgi:hypothetical protein